MWGSDFSYILLFFLTFFNWLIIAATDFLPNQTFTLCYLIITESYATPGASLALLFLIIVILLPLFRLLSFVFRTFILILLIRLSICSSSCSVSGLQIIFIHFVVFGHLFSGGGTKAATSLDLAVQVDRSLYVSFQHRHTLKCEVEPLCEECLNALNITREVELRVLVRS